MRAYTDTQSCTQILCIPSFWVLVLDTGFSQRIVPGSSTESRPRKVPAKRGGYKDSFGLINAKRIETLISALPWSYLLAQRATPLFANERYLALFAPHPIVLPTSTKSRISRKFYTIEKTYNFLQYTYNAMLDSTIGNRLMYMAQLAYWSRLVRQVLLAHV